MNREYRTTAYQADTRIETLNQVSVRLAAALLSHWSDAEPTPVEIHLEGQSKIGKSTFVANTATMLWDQHVWHDDFHAERDVISKNGISIVSLDEGRRRFTWTYGNNRCEIVEALPAGKAILFVENPCATRLLYTDNDYKEVETKPQIVMEFTIPARQICQRLCALDRTLRQPVERAALEGLMETEEWGSRLSDRFLYRLREACDNFAKKSATKRHDVEQILALRKVDTVFDSRTFPSNGQVISTFKNNDVTPKLVEAKFRHLKTEASRALPRLMVYRRSQAADARS